MINIIISILIIYSLIITIKLILINKKINYKDRLFMLLRELETIQNDVYICDDIDKMWKYYRSIDDVIFRAYHGKDAV